MKTLYIECNMGVAGDMLMSALSELLPNQNEFIDKLNSLNIPNVVYENKKVSKCGIVGTHIDVSVGGVREDEHMHEHHHEHVHEHHHEHHHAGMHDIEHIISHLDLPDKVRKDVLAVYGLIAEAESVAHGCTVDEIHFHEVGTMDAVADVVGVCMMMNEINADNIVVSPVHVGCGTVKCAHGVLPVPAPATAHILRGVPTYGGEIKGELCTPTGASLVKYFADSFGKMPIMTVSNIGYGMGTKDFETANCVRVMLGETENKTDTVYELKCNIDDMTGEEIAYAMNVLLENGALDVFTAPIGMKKSRSGIMLTCLCNEKDRGELVKLMFKHTSTIGIRETETNRYVLDRQLAEIETKYGTVRVKKSTGYGVTKYKAEYEDVARIATENNISIAEVKKEIGSL